MATDRVPHENHGAPYGPDALKVIINLLRESEQLSSALLAYIWRPVSQVPVANLQQTQKLNSARFLWLGQRITLGFSLHFIPRSLSLSILTIDSQPRRRNECVRQSSARDLVH